MEHSLRAVTESCAQIAGFPTARQPYARLARVSSASKNPLYLGPTRRRPESSRTGDRGADFSVEVPGLVGHESALPLYTGQYLSPLGPSGNFKKMYLYDF